MVVLVVHVLVAVVEVEVPRVVRIGSILSARPVVVGLLFVYPLMAKKIALAPPEGNPVSGYPYPA